jgi:hypothetical protein
LITSYDGKISTAENEFLVTNLASTRPDLEKIYPIPFYPEQ